jgi:hypothetical protein
MSDSRLSVFRRSSWALAALAAGCALKTPAPEASAPPAPAPVPAPPPVVVVVAPPAPAPTQPSPQELADAATRRVLAYQEQLRTLPGPEVAAEVGRLNGQLPSHQGASWAATALELALALAQTRNPGDLTRAIGLVDPVARSAAPEFQPWQPVARLLAARLAEQRRLEEQLERQAVQLRESQRNVQQLNEKLEALKAIERSLNNRAPTPPAPAPAPPASGTAAPRAP